MNKKYIWWIVAAVVIAGFTVVFGRGGARSEAELIVRVEHGDFEVLVTVTGELQARNFVNIMGPQIPAGVLRINEFRIMDLVDEGTQVEAGDIVAQLDRAAANLAVLDHEDAIEQTQNRIETMRMDSMVNLRGLRDNLINLRIAIEEAEIQVEQGIFEPPATQRQFENNLDRAVRALEHAKAQYDLRVRQHEMNIADQEMRLARQIRIHEQMLDVLEGFTVRAPQPGMVVYHRDRFGQRRRAGSSINQHDRVVATLPDLSEMVSRAFINEIDISRVRRGQEVRIGLDAFPDRSYTGIIIRVSDIGEQLAGTDAKLFEVMIEVNESDPVMRPAMTTSNTIVTNMLTDVTFVSIDAIYTLDTIPFVYTTNNTRQIVVLGEANENQVIIEHGLSPGDRVFVTTPANSANWRLVGEELIPIIAQRAEERRIEREEQDRLLAEQASGRGRWSGNPDGARTGDGGPTPRGPGGQFPGGGGGGQRGGGGQ